MNTLYDLSVKEAAYRFCEKYNMTASVSDDPAGMVFDRYTEFDRYIDKLCEVKNKDVY